MIFFPADRGEDSKTNSPIGKCLSASIFNSSCPTAPEDPKIATFNGLFGKNEESFTLIKTINLTNNPEYYFIKKS